MFLSDILNFRGAVHSLQFTAYSSQLTVHSLMLSSSVENNRRRITTESLNILH